jgi:LPS sulfotransferase NodH
MKRLIKRTARHIPGATRLSKRAWVEVRRLGERARFALAGTPPPGHAWLLASSGRSGSTWLGDMLAALPGVQAIFEPLDPRNSARYRQLMAWPAHAPSSTLRRHYLRPSECAPQWADFWQQVLQGHVRTYLTDYDRTSFFPQRFLIKSIRANMMLGFVDEHFHPPIIFLSRHPGAVINSMFYRVRASWPASAQAILRQEKLVADHLQPWVRQVEQVQDGFEAQALWWALENRVGSRQMHGREYFHIFYEDLALRPRQTMDALLRWLGAPPEALPQAMFQRLSRMTSVTQRQSVEDDAMKRLSAWQRELSTDEQRIVLQWAERLEIEWYDAGPLPRYTSGPRPTA